MYYVLPLTEDPRQVFTLDLMIDGDPFHARVEIRYLPGPDRWFLTVSDAATGEMYVNQIPLVCSYTYLNDLFFPFLHLFQGSGIGSFFVVKAVDVPSTPDPAEGSLEEFQLLWTDRYPAG